MIPEAQKNTEEASPSSSMTIESERMRKSRAMVMMLEQTARLIYADRHPKDLHAVQWSALRYLNRSGENTRNVVGLAKYLGVTSGPASRTASSLLNRKLITATPSPTDARSKIFNLTEEGKSELEGDPITKAASALEDLDDDQVALLSMALDTLYSAMSKSALNTSGHRLQR